MNRPLLLLTIVFLLLASAVAPGLAQSDCDFSISNYARAVQLHDMGDYGRALRHYDCALLEDPDDSIIPILIENLYEDIESASHAWDSPQQPLCDPARNHGELGAAAFNRGDSSGAQTHLHCALLADPADLAALTQMGRIHANLGDAHSAKHYLDRAELARAGQADASAPASGFVMPEWLKPYEIVPRQNARSTSGISRLGELALAPDGRRVYVLMLTARIVVKADDAAPDARELARQASQRGDIDAAIQWMLQVTNAASATAEDYIFLAELYGEKDDLKAAALALSAAVELAPARLDIRCSLGKTYKTLGDYARASAQFFRVIAHEIGDICGERSQLEFSRPSKPEKEYSADSISPAQATFDRGLAFLSARKRYAAANTFLAALEIDPEHRAARCHLGMIFTKWANYAGALAQFDHIQALDPQDQCARQNRKAAVMRMMAMYVPLTVDDFFFHARAYVQVEEWQRALDMFERGLERDPARRDVRCELGMIYAALGDEQAALREFDHVLTHDAMDPCARSNREGLLQRLRDQR